MTVAWVSFFCRTIIDLLILQTWGNYFSIVMITIIIILLHHDYNKGAAMSTDPSLD